MKRIAIMFLAGIICLLAACCNNLMDTPESYRYIGTQSYNYSKDAPYAAKQFVRQHINPIRYEDDYTKAVKIISIVCRQMTYDYTALNGTRADKVRANDLNNFFCTGTGICWCYSRAYCYLCREAGLECYEIVGYVNYNGQSVCHSWNAVKINGVRYYVDCCFFDTGASFQECFANRALPNHTFSYL